MGFGYGIIVGPILVLAASDFTGELLSASQSVALVLRQIGLVLAAAIFISVLNTNANTAKTNSISYAKSQIIQLNLPILQENDMINEVTTQISQEKNTTPSKYEVSNTEKEELIAENIAKIIGKNPVSPAVQEQIQTQVTAEVSQTIKKTEAKVNSAISDITGHTKDQFSQAFIGIYKSSTLIVFISSAFCFLFKRKEKNV
jgi:hypothetical protein